MEKDGKGRNIRMKILTLGDSKVGKSSFIIKYTGQVFDESMLTTIGLDIQTSFIMVKDKKYRIDFYDTTGQEKYRSIANSYIKNADGVILMYDISDKSSYEHIPGWMESIIDNKGSDFPIILLGNKSDLEDRRQVDLEEGKKLADKYKLKFMETSNKNGTTIQEAALEIVNLILEKKAREENEKSDSIQLDKNNHKTIEDEKRKKLCCLKK